MKRRAAAEYSEPDARLLYAALRRATKPSPASPDSSSQAAAGSGTGANAPTGPVIWASWLEH